MQTRTLSRVDRIVLDAMLCGVALMLSFLESILPLSLIIPLPGIKLGLANAVVIIAAFKISCIDAAAISILRVTLSSLLFGSLTTAAFSAGGAILSFLIIALLCRVNDSLLSKTGISIASAAAHNIGQTAVACVVMKSAAILGYLPVLLLISIPTGIVVGALSTLVCDNKSLWRGINL